MSSKKDFFFRIFHLLLPEYSCNELTIGMKWARVEMGAVDQRNKLSFSCVLILYYNFVFSLQQSAKVNKSQSHQFGANEYLF